MGFGCVLLCHFSSCSLRCPAKSLEKCEKCASITTVKKVQQKYHNYCFYLTSFFVLLCIVCKFLTWKQRNFSELKTFFHEFSSKLTQINLIYHKSEFRVGFSYLFLVFRQLLVSCHLLIVVAHQTMKLHRKKRVLEILCVEWREKMSLPSLFVGLFKEFVSINIWTTVT